MYAYMYMYVIVYVYIFVYVYILSQTYTHIRIYAGAGVVLDRTPAASLLQQFMPHVPSCKSAAVRMQECGSQDCLELASTLRSRSARQGVAWEGGKVAGARRNESKGTARTPRRATVLQLEPSDAHMNHLSEARNPQS